jgi:hypothetical protein
MDETPLPETTLRAVLDELIPRRGSSLPGAGALGLGDYVEAQLGEAKAGVASAFAALEARASGAGAENFASLSDEVRADLLREVASGHPGFLEILIFHLYSGYYQHPSVVEAIGLESRPPYPKGYPLELGDLGLLDPVRNRPRFYREA